MPLARSDGDTVGLARGKIRIVLKIVLEICLPVKYCMNIHFLNPNTGTHHDHTQSISLSELGPYGDSRAPLQYPHGKGLC